MGRDILRIPGTGYGRSQPHHNTEAAMPMPDTAPSNALVLCERGIAHSPYCAHIRSMERAALVLAPCDCGAMEQAYDDLAAKLNGVKDDLHTASEGWSSALKELAKYRAEEDGRAYDEDYDEDGDEICGRCELLPEFCECEYDEFEDDEDDDNGLGTKGDPCGDDDACCYDYVAPEELSEEAQELTTPGAPYDYDETMKEANAAPAQPLAEAAEANGAGESVEETPAAYQSIASLAEADSVKKAFGGAFSIDLTNPNPWLFETNSENPSALTMANLSIILANRIAVCQTVGNTAPLQAVGPAARAVAQLTARQENTRLALLDYADDMMERIPAIERSAFVQNLMPRFEKNVLAADQYADEDEKKAHEEYIAWLTELEDRGGADAAETFTKLVLGPTLTPAEKFILLRGLLTNYTPSLRNRQNDPDIKFLYAIRNAAGKAERHVRFTPLLEFEIGNKMSGIVEGAYGKITKHWLDAAAWSQASNSSNDQPGDCLRRLKTVVEDIFGPQSYSWAKRLLTIYE